jgi:hypothetical protein
MKKKFGFIMVVAALVMLFLSSGSVFADGVKGFSITGDFTDTPCNATLGTGGDLWTLLEGTCGGIRQPLPNAMNPTNHNWIEGDYVLVTGGNGSSALYSVGELDTGYARANAVTISCDKKGRCDLAGEGRAVRNVTNIDVVHAVPIGKGVETVHPVSNEFVVSGAGITPQTYNLADLGKMAQETYTSTASQNKGAVVTYTGPTLLRILADAGINTKDMNSYVVVQAVDGYATLLSMYEATHMTGTQVDDLLAISASDKSINGTTTSDSGVVRLILPGDSAPGRWVSNVDQIVVYKLED